jgi:hypothetical protein
MTVGDLIKVLFWGGLAVWLLIALFRKTPLPKMLVENRTHVEDAPTDHVNITIFFPNKAAARIARLSIDGNQVDLTDSTKGHQRSCRSTSSMHQLLLKVGRRTYPYPLNCSVNGRYEIHLKPDRIWGGLSEDVRVVVAQP